MGSNNKVVSITRSLSESQKCDLLKLWNSEFPTQIGFEDMEALEAYLHKLGNKKHYLIDDQDVMVAWLCVFERNDEVWFIIIISLDHQGKRLGSRLMKAAQEDNKALKGWITSHNDYKKADGSIYPSPRMFYQKLGFEIHEQETLTKGGITSMLISWKQSAV